MAIERPSNGASDEFAYEDHTGDPRAHMAAVMLDLWDGLGIDRAPVVANSIGFDKIVAAVDAPATIVWGDEDAFGTPEAGRDLATKLGAEFHLVVDAGQLPWYDDPDAVVTAILGALGDDSSHA